MCSEVLMYFIWAPLSVSNGSDLSASLFGQMFSQRQVSLHIWTAAAGKTPRGGPTCGPEPRGPPETTTGTRTTSVSVCGQLIQNRHKHTTRKLFNSEYRDSEWEELNSQCVNGHRSLSLTHTHTHTHAHLTPPLRTGPTAAASELSGNFPSLSSTAERDAPRPGPRAARPGSARPQTLFSSQHGSGPDCF